MRRKRMASVLALGAALLYTGSIVLYAANSASIRGRFQTGAVNIRLEEYQIAEDGKEERWDNGQNQYILPGQEISKIPRIICQPGSADCYVRADVSFGSGREGWSLDDAALEGLGNDWIKAEDGYYYCTEILKAGGQTDIFQGVRIPEDMPQEMAGSTQKIKIHAEAIQSRNFEPDFSSGAPWGDVSIQEYSQNEDGDSTLIYEPGGASPISLTYEGDSKEILINADDLFRDFPTLMPGDSWTGRMQMQNTGKRTASLYFRSLVVKQTGLTDAMQISINVDAGAGQERQIYDGSVSGCAFNGNILLAQLESGKKGTITYTLSMPAGLDNQYTLADGEVLWTFSTEEISSSGAAKTGDASRIAFFLFLGATSLLVAALAIWKRKGGKTNEEGD